MAARDRPFAPACAAAGMSENPDYLDQISQLFYGI
jgi:hypothetical protein